MSGRGAGDSEKPAADTSGAAVVISVDASPDEADPTTPESGARDRRSSDRMDVLWSVDCETEETFLYAAITNISAMGIFVRTTDPLPIGTHVTLRFAPPPTREPFALTGVVQWVNTIRPQKDNPNPGMGIRFMSLTLADRERIVEAIHTIAYLREEPRPRSASDSGN
jgi:type IV pilus assembly protein PilZ